MQKEKWKLFDHVFVERILNYEDANSFEIIVFIKTRIRRKKKNFRHTKNSVRRPLRKLCDMVFTDENKVLILCEIILPLLKCVRLTMTMMHPLSINIQFKKILLCTGFTYSMWLRLIGVVGYLIGFL